MDEQTGLQARARLMGLVYDFETVIVQLRGRGRISLIASRAPYIWCTTAMGALVVLLLLPCLLAIAWEMSDRGLIQWSSGADACVAHSMPRARPLTHSTRDGEVAVQQLLGALQCLASRGARQRGLPSWLLLRSKEAGDSVAGAEELVGICHHHLPASVAPAVHPTCIVALLTEDYAHVPLLLLPNMTRVEPERLSLIRESPVLLRQYSLLMGDRVSQRLPQYAVYTENPLTHRVQLQHVEGDVAFFVQMALEEVDKLQRASRERTDAD